MKRLFAAARKLVAQESGATMVEYGLMVALIAVVAVAAVTLLGTNISALFTTIAGSI
jgi:pilus assembly protein Flp/PilA